MRLDKLLSLACSNFHYSLFLAIFLHVFVAVHPAAIFAPSPAAEAISPLSNQQGYN